MGDFLAGKSLWCQQKGLDQMAHFPGLCNNTPPNPTATFTVFSPAWL